MRLFFLILCFPFLAISQSDTLIDGTNYQVKYFNSGEVSTLYPQLKPNSKGSVGTTWAFNEEGRIIFETEVRRVAGYSKVKYAYHENGGIKMAQYTSHPDGGIQRTYINSYFDEDGVLLRKEDLSDDGFGPEIVKDQPEMTNLHDREIAPFIKVEETKKEYVTRAIIINSSKKKIKFLMKDFSEDHGEVKKYALKPGDTLKLATYVTEDGFDQIEQHFYIESKNKQRRKEFSAKTEDTFPEGILTQRLAVIQLYRRSE